MDKDAFYMRRAIELATRGDGLTLPNPMVGCVVVRGTEGLTSEDELIGDIITEGWHKRCGAYHAERDALTRCDEDVNGATMYVTLEPCCHHGKTPPCTDIIIERGIKRVYVGSDDPNPLVAGKGIEILKAAGIEVITHLLKDECDRLNEVFFYHITHELPFVAMKYAMTLDGKIATRSGDSKWITGESARKHVHGLRKSYDAILVGVGTVISDDPMLNYRGEMSLPEVDISEYNPVRVVLDSALRTPLGSAIVSTAKDIKTYIAHKPMDDTDDELISRYEALKDRGVNLIEISEDDNGHISVPKLLKALYDEGIYSVLVEGGSTVHGSFLMEKEYVGRVYAYIAPKLIGGREALTPIGGEGYDVLSDGAVLRECESVVIGDDILITGLVS